MRIIDMLGKPCPIPVVEARRALEDENIDSILVKIDNEISLDNLQKMANSAGFAVSGIKKIDDTYEIVISKTNNLSAEIITKPRNGAMAVVIGSDAMGNGEAELGRILIKGFIYALSQLPQPPDTLIFLNSGAKLTAVGANTIDDLKALADKGAEILTCGTCINYYKLGQPSIGEIANMYDIVEKMSIADRVVNI
ncbi:MAG: sulfurtransferase-like selenium metabolism protein YedF [Defluviitaleaceae bacterium]|nr:sulfurtransferase-like selenium metabolism protein YedF [Defluviitaleaceae bacterium]